MQIIKYRSLFTDVPINCPSTVEEGDLNAKKAGAVLKGFIDNTVYRGVLNEFREWLIHGREAVAAKDNKPAIEAIQGLEEITGVPMKTQSKVVGKKTVEVYDETDGEYIKRVAAVKGWDLDQEPNELQPYADIVAKFLVFDASVSESKPKGPVKLPADYLEAGLRIIDKGNQAKYGRFNIVWTNDRDKDATLLGWKIREEVLAKQREATKGYE